MQTALSFIGMDAVTLFWIVAVFLLAGCVKGVIGLGLPTVAVGLLSLLMSPVQAAALLIVPSLVTNVWQLLAGGSFMFLLRRLWSMQLGIVAGTLMGMGFMRGQSGATAFVALGGALVLYALAGLAQVNFSVAPVRQKWWSPLVGVATGLITAATGVFVIPAVPYLQALGLQRDELIQALGLSFTVSTLALAVNLGTGGMFHAANAGVSLLAVLPALAGMYLGQWIRAKVRPETFKRYFFIGLLLLGVELAARAW
ncbi:sulfite exporter TauE/SafE family protein [Herbaspirillum lusitanum]|uniref:Probable membrane transporter protein n=1 Tax=Herbaspirillum lusitanum TaxID=213312 RepID=A0ABW9A4Q8_9BURK